MRLRPGSRPTLKTAAAIYLLAHAAVAVLGLPAIFLPVVREWRWPPKIATAFALGAVAVSVEATVLTLAGVPWTLAAFSLPTAIALIVLARQRTPWRVPRPTVPRARRAVRLFSVALGTLASAHLALSLATARSTSVDFLLFWGVKALRFARARALDPALLRWALFQHAQPFYPPLVPVVDALGVSAAGEMPWVVAPLAALLWFGAAAILVHAILRERIVEIAAPVTAFWMAGLGISLAFSFSGGNAEAPLLLYESVAAALVLTEGKEPTAGRRCLAGLFLAGAVLTKVEGSVAAALWIAGVALRDLIVSRRVVVRGLAPLAVPPLLAAGLWAVFLRRFSIGIAYGGRGGLFELHWGGVGRAMALVLENMSSGSLWLAWIIPLAVLAISLSRKELRQSLPGFMALTGTFAFFLFVYSHHESGNVAQRISWEIPRISQPALSLLILMASLAAGRARESTGNCPAQSCLWSSGRRPVPASTHRR